ncbi:hypothetical protein H8356DRAFT_923809 [Neocallimastix lanati (nom. inval.)]|nr:hypothetical protein H8356DRAFT_923809 [Neocallimastix sp. JGI-2020a]
MDEDYIEPCSICLFDLIPENKDETENLGILSCNHKFHEQCIKLWSEKAKACTCPIDRGVFSEIKIYSYNGEYLSTYAIKKKEKNEEIEIEDLSYCIICGRSDHEEIMLLCDICDAPYHTTCLGLNSIPDGNWYCPKCVSENPALEYSMVIDNDPSDIEILYETPSVSEISTSVDSKKRTQSNENTKKSRGKKSKSRTIANSNNKRIKASRSLISKLRREIHQRRQYNIKVNKCLFEEISLINIPRNNFNEYLDAYRASTSDNVSTRNLSSLRERLKYETKRKYSKMLDTQSVNNIYEKPSSYNRNSEYDLVWRQAKLAKKIQPNSSSSFSKNSFKIKENKSFSSLKRLNITLKRMTEQETNRNNNNNKYNNDDSKNNRNNNNYNSASSSNNINNPIKINNKSYINHKSRTSSKDHNGYSSREIFKFIRPYIKKRVKSRYITREQYKKLTRDTTFYVIKRLGNNYTGEHKLNYEELKKDFLYDHSFSNKIIINFVNYNIIKFLEINKKMTNSSSKNTPKHPKPI